MQMSASISTVADKKSGLFYWAQRVVEECDNASHDFAADPVHDLRVAIRRCRSMADGFLSVDPDPGWKQMKRMAKPLFSALGELRDVQVMMEWVTKLSTPEDPARPILLLELQAREDKLKAAAKQALADFDRKHWISLNERLSERAEKVPLGGDRLPITRAGALEGRAGASSQSSAQPLRSFLSPVAYWHQAAAIHGGKLSARIA